MYHMYYMYYMTYVPYVLYGMSCILLDRIVWSCKTAAVDFKIAMSPCRSACTCSKWELLDLNQSQAIQQP